MMAFAREHLALTIFLAYLLIGILNAAQFAWRDRDQLFKKRGVIVQRATGLRTKTTRGLPLFFFTAVFNTLFWSVQLLFWFIFVPIHDHFALKAYRREMNP